MVLKLKIMLKKIIGTFQLLGGLWGVLAFSGEAIKGKYIVLIGIPFFLLSMWAGQALLFNKKNARITTFVNQALQIIKIKVFGIVFYYCSGIGLYVNIGKTSAGMSSNFGGGFMVGTINTTPGIISINLIAILIIILMIKYKIK